MQPKFTPAEESLMDKEYEIVDSSGNPVLDELPQKEALNLLSPETLSKLRKQYVTVKLPVVKACMHRLDISRQPRHKNCEHCWFAFFSSHKNVVDQIHEMFTNGLAQTIVDLQGYKYLSNYLKFMATLAKWRAEQEKLNAHNGTEN